MSNLFDLTGRPIVEGQMVQTPFMGMLEGQLVKISTTALTGGDGELRPPYGILIIPVTLKALQGKPGRSPALNCFITLDTPEGYISPFERPGGDLSINLGGR